MKRRSRMDLFATLIKRVSQDELTTNRIMILENLSSKLAKDLLVRLQASGLVVSRVVGRRTVYTATNTGLEFLNGYIQVLRVLEHRI